MESFKHYALAAAALALVMLTDVRALTEQELQAFSDTIQIRDNGDGTYQLTATGFPNHEYDDTVNPNAASAQSYNFTISSSPTTGGKYCTSLGPIGFAFNGVPLFNALTIESLDAVLHEQFDSCQGHSDNRGAYHYHQFPGCVGDTSVEDQFIGVALDGHPIYGPRASDKSELLTSADLDGCHGRTVGGVYRYHITMDFPYVLGCFVSEPAVTAGGGEGPPPTGGGNPPPPRRRRRQTAEVTCTNTDGGAQLCDCSSGSTYQACDVRVEGGDCTSETNNDSSSNNDSGSNSNDGGSNDGSGNNQNDDGDNAAMRAGECIVLMIASVCIVLF